MKRNSRNRNQFQLKPLKIDLNEAEIMADLRYGVGSKIRPESADHRDQVTR